MTFFVSDIQVDCIRETVKKITADYVANADLFSTIMADSTAGNIAVTMPDAETYNERIITVVKTDASPNTVSAEGIVMAAQYDGKRFQSDGVAWIPLP